MSRPQESGLVYFVADGLTLLVEASVYFISLLPAVAMVLGAWEDGVWRTVLALVVAWYLSALVFVLIIVGISLPGSSAGLKLFLYPDFSKLTGKLVHEPPVRRPAGNGFYLS